MDKESKEKYERYKAIVKSWEYDFKKKSGRVPSKHDIKDAPYNVKQAYKMYYRMKTSFLTQTLTDVLEEENDDYSQQQLEFQNSDDFLDLSHLSASFCADFTIPESINELMDPTKKIPIGNSLMKKKQNEQSFEAVAQDLHNVDNVWNSSLNKPKLRSPDNTKKSQPVEKSSPKIQLKLDQVKIKPPRNPKKPLSKTKSLKSFDGDEKEKDLLPDLETILLEKSRLERGIDIKKVEKPSETEIKTAVDTNWLERNDPESSMEKSYQNSAVTSTKAHFGISNLKLNSHHPIEAIFNSDNMSDSEYVESQQVSKEEILPIAKKRRLSNDFIETPQASSSHTNLSTINEQETNIAKQVPEKPKRKTVQKKSNEVAPVQPSVHAFETDDDDSDKDPNFEQQKDEKSPSPVLMKRKRSLIKRSKEGITKATKKAAAKILKRSRKSLKISDQDETIDNDQPPAEEENINFFVDTNVENIKCVPRVSDKEIKSSEKVFDEYVLQNMQQSSEMKVVDYKTATKKDALQKRIATGTLNDNFVRVNLKKKVFVRGKKAFSFSQYKKKLWKSKKNAVSALDDMRGCDGGVLKCFNCGGVGHFAAQCKKKEDNLLPIEADTGEESTLPTLEEAAQMASDKKLLVHARKPDSIPTNSNDIWREENKAMEVDVSNEQHNKENTSANYAEIPTTSNAIAPKKSYIGHTIPEDFLKKSGILEINAGDKEEVKPYLCLNEDGSIPQEVPKEVTQALRQFGHKSFRPGQENAVMRVLCGMSTLVTLSTGSGKSLIYQLPAYLYRQKSHCITLVISPLVSLMEDQVYGIPDFINAQCLHTNQTPKQREKVMEEIKNGRVEILLVSPEAVVASEKSTGFGAILRQLPPIAFATIDEAHSLSEWSHNFRPSYLMICRVLREKLGVKNILGLTATATLQIRKTIIEHLSIPDGLNGIISDVPLPDNLILTISKDENRDKALIELLRSERFDELKSIIIYCTRRDECERIAGYLRTCLQDKVAEFAQEKTATKKRKRAAWLAEAYHAGLQASRRRTVQKAFMNGDLRIVVATVAFGMGINIANIRGIIHYNMPKSFENYVQEVGRAGRDGKMSHCHVFLSSRGEDLSELRRHIYANSIDRHVIRKLLQKIFIPCACKSRLKNEKEEEEEVKTSKRICPGHEVCFSIEESIQTLDIPEENIATLLCYLELHDNRYIKILGNAYTMCKIISYNGASYMKQMAKTCPPLAMSIALHLKSGKAKDDLSSIEFNVIDVASAIGWDSGVVKYQLKQLEWTTTPNGYRKRSPLTVTFSDLGFRLRAPGDLSSRELDQTLDSLETRTRLQERTQLVQLQMIFDSFMSVAFPSFSKCKSNDNNMTIKSNELKAIIRKYFQSILEMDVELTDEVDNTSDEEIISSIRQMVQMYPENSFSGRSLARIFHGITSPCFPAVIWGRCKFWRAHLSVNFQRLVRLGNREIVKIRLN